MNTLRQDIEGVLKTVEQRENGYLYEDVDSLLELFKHHMEEMIGEDEKAEYTDTQTEGGKAAVYTYKVENNLRRRQRELLQKVKEIK